jgi:threonine dehydratase
MAEVVLDDLPGSLAHLLSVIAGAGGNILQIHHARGGRDIPVRSVRVALEIETRDGEHGRELARVVEEAGYLLAVMGGASSTAGR